MGGADTTGEENLIRGTWYIFQSNLINPQEIKAPMTESKLNLLKPQKAPATMVTAQCMKWKDMPFASCRHYSSNLTESHYKRGEKKLRHNQNQTSFLSLVVTDLFSFWPKF